MEPVEPLAELRGDDGDEAGRQTALGNEGAGGTLGQQLDMPGGGDVFGQVQVVCAGKSCGLCDLGRQVVGRRAQHGELAGQGGLQAARGDVQLEPGDGRRGLQPGQLF